MNYTVSSREFNRVLNEERGVSQQCRLLHEFFEAQVHCRPEHPAVEFLDERVSYIELERQANRIAHALSHKGVQPHDLVGLYLCKSPRLYAAMLGILKAGAAYVPIDARFPLDRIQSIAEDAGLRLIVSEGALADGLAEGVQSPLLRLDHEKDLLAAQPADPLTDRNAVTPPNALCYVIYTSGSTGKPKGVMIEHGNAVAFVEALGSVYRVQETDRVYQGFSTAFDASVEEIWAAFARGGTLVVPPVEVERSPSDVAEFIIRNNITYFSTVPTMLAMIDRDLPSVRTLVLGGEACSDELVTRWAVQGRRMLNTYGPTEATVVATCSECIPGEPVSIGRALPNYSTYVLDETLKQVKPGETGELFIGGPGVARGYRNLRDLTATRFIANPFKSADDTRLYRTLDKVRLGTDGALYFLGRLDDQVKIRGFRIELSEIEAVLIQHPAINAAAVAVRGSAHEADLAAYVVPTVPDVELPRDELAALLRGRLPSYMVPKYLDIIALLPMTSSGKVDRKALPAPRTLLQSTREVIAPDGELETQIVNDWAEAFKLPEVSVEADFFLDLGGHSLVAAQCASSLRATLGSIPVSVRDIYEFRTVRALANALQARFGASSPTTEPATERGADVSASSATPAVHPAMRWLTVTLQALGIAFYYGLVASPLVYAAIITLEVLNGKLDWTYVAEISTIVAFAAWPAMLALSIAIKWLVIGRYKPGRYPLWSMYYFRWWLVTRFQALSWSNMFSGTPLMSLYWRAMGARIGRNVLLRTPHCAAFDMVSIGDGTSVGLETQLLGCHVVDGHLVIAPVQIGDNCFVGMHCAVGIDTLIGDGARLDDLSMVPDGARLEAGSGWRGSPVRPAQVSLPPLQAIASSRLRVAVYGVLHLALIYVMGYFLIATSLPSIAMISAGLILGGPLGGIIAVVLAVPVAIVSYALGAIGLKSLLGRTRSGRMPVHSAGYLKHWFTAYLLENTLTILRPVYATVYMPTLLRLLGVKVGKGAEISTVSHFTPDTLEIGDGSFLADACLVGGERIHGGTVEIGNVRIGTRSFVGNSALLPGGCSIGSNALLGVASSPPPGLDQIPSDTRWLGAPAFSLPTTQCSKKFAEEAIFSPTRSAVVQRTLTDTLRILLPGLIGGVNAIAMVAYLAYALPLLPLWQLLATVPFVATVLAFSAILLSALVKRLFVGRIQPVVQPLWSRFVWNNELVNGVYESAAASAMAPLMGTPYISTALRLMGCRVGKWCFIETTLFSEFDLVEIGDRACLNLGATIQTHLFEDRVFKADRLKIGDDCTVGNMAFVLYSTEMEKGSRLGPLSLLMKGERLQAGTEWHGNPCEQVVMSA